MWSLCVRDKKEVLSSVLSRLFYSFFRFLGVLLSEIWVYFDGDVFVFAGVLGLNWWGGLVGLNGWENVSLLRWGLLEGCLRVWLSYEEVCYGIRQILVFFISHRFLRYLSSVIIRFALWLRQNRSTDDTDAVVENLHKKNAPEREIQGLWLCF